MKTKNQLIDPNWVNKNQELVCKYAGQWIAINNEKGIIGSGVSLKALKSRCDAMKIPYIFYSVSPHFDKVRFLPIYFKGVITHKWRPVYPVKIINGNKVLNELFLIDSGADCSLISKSAGEILGFRKQKDDPIFTAYGVGGIVEFILKRVDCIINDHKLNISIAWIQTVGVKDLIIGRDIVFDYFDIEFQQRIEKVIFKKVNTSNKL